MICPNCDAMLGGGICQGCGWRTGNPWPASRLVTGTTHPMKAVELYPPQEGVAKDNIVATAQPDQSEITRANAEDGEQPVGNIEPYQRFTPEVTPEILETVSNDMDTGVKTPDLRERPAKTKPGKDVQ